jgi:hypothetical protein
MIDKVRSVAMLETLAVERGCPQGAPGL